MRHVPTCGSDDGLTGDDTQRQKKGKSQDRRRSDKKDDMNNEKKVRQRKHANILSQGTECRLHARDALNKGWNAMGRQEERNAEHVMNVVR